MAAPLNIAHCVESYAPASGGMAEVARQLSERMVRMGHRVTVLTSPHPARTTDELNGVRIRSFALRGNAVEGIAGDMEDYMRALRDGGFDVVVFFAAQQWATDAVLPRLKEIAARKVFVPTGFSALHDARWKDYYDHMPQRLSAMDLNVFHSEHYQDVTFAKTHGITNWTLIPNGAAEEEFSGPLTHDIRQAFGIATARPIVLHLGSYTGIKGHREAIDIFLKARTGDAVLMLVGNGTQRLQHDFHRHYSYFLARLRARVKRKRILFLELDRPHTVSALRQADLFLFPSNVECSPIVLFEAMAAGVPFLSSRAGNAAEIAGWTQGGWIIPGRRDATQRERPDVAEGARLLTRLLADEQRLRSAGQAGRRAWKERFTWQHITEQYVAAYERLVTERT